MKVFHCSHCEHLVFFENSICVNCQRTLAYLPDLQVIGSLESVGENLWHCPLSQQRLYRLCDNYHRENVCNWAIPEDEPYQLCYSCRFTQVIPDLGDPNNGPAWYKLEAAKRRVLYGLLMLECPLKNKVEDPEHGLAFTFLVDTGDPVAGPVLTGHANGIITINLAEADDVERERRRQQLHEPYRTLLGHFRHEIGHYYWDRLIKESSTIEAFRESFGDERKDYGQALQDHYQQGPPQDWPQRFVSAYAASHPWEDWAETWAHYLHMTDAIQTAAACGVTLRPKRADEPRLRTVDPAKTNFDSFDELIERWFPLTYVLNNLNRGLGLPDAYPFVLSSVAIEKLRLVHETIRGMSSVDQTGKPVTLRIG